MSKHSGPLAQIAELVPGDTATEADPQAPSTDAENAALPTGQESATDSVVETA